ncbi:MAG: hypothetical protein EXQ84_06865 [Rhodospirillaceae bacterium]|nr:hypothetical protein [Rhodospirillaceae bacterium]
MNTALSYTYPALRFAIYLQDTQNQSGGLKVGVGTHHMDVSSFKNINLHLQNVDSVPGDVIVFTHRILHSPLALRLKSDPRRVLTPEEEDERCFRHPDDFLPMPGLRDTIFIDYMSTEETVDAYIKNRALVSQDSTNALAKFLVDDGFLDKNIDSPFAFRVDTAIVETVRNARNRIVNRQIDREGQEILERLPRLCQAHFETSCHHVLHDSEVGDLSLKTAVRLAQEISPRLDRLDAQRAVMKRDLHMGPTPTAKLIKAQLAGAR